MTTGETFHMTDCVLDLLNEVSQWHHKYQNRDTPWCDFVNSGPEFFFDGCPGFPEKVTDPEFRKNWEAACSILRDHGALKEGQWCGVTCSILRLDRLREILTLAVIDPEEPMEKPATSATQNPDGNGLLDRLFAVSLFLNLLKDIHGSLSPRSVWNDIFEGPYQRLEHRPEFAAADAGSWFTIGVWDHMVKYMREEGVIEKDVDGKNVVNIGPLQNLQKHLIDMLRVHICVRRTASGVFTPYTRHLGSGGVHTLAISAYTADNDRGTNVFLVLDGMPIGWLSAVWESEDPPAKVGGIVDDTLPTVDPLISMLVSTHDESGIGISPSEEREKTESKITALRTKLNDIFNQSISSGPMPHRAAICIIETMSSEYGSSDEFATRAGDFFAEAQKIGKNPIRYAAWLACSELLSRVRAIVKGLEPENDGCLIDEYESALKNLAERSET